MSSSVAHTAPTPSSGHTIEVTPGDLYTEFKENSGSHLLRFAVFLIPLIGAIYKTTEIVFSSSNVKEIDKKWMDKVAARREITKYINQLQVSDILFGLASSVEVVAAVALGLTPISILAFLGVTVCVKTAILIANKRGMLDGYILTKSHARKLPSVATKEVAAYPFSKYERLKVGFYFTTYCVPLLGVFLKRNKSLCLKAEYLNLDTSTQRRAQLERIQKIHNRCFFVAKAVSLSIAFGVASLLMTHPVVLLAFSVSLIVSSYLGGKIDIEEAYLEDYKEWKNDLVDTLVRQRTGSYSLQVEGFPKEGVPIIRSVKNKQSFL